jgi:hypothetical protein
VLESRTGRRPSQIAVLAKLPEGAAGEGTYVLPFSTMVLTGSSGTDMARSWEVAILAEELVEELCWPQAGQPEAAH